ncbi:MAG: Ger(x)C family spore germination C-terminal domain-containing protein [Clostridiales bacterium]|nr:Ger(x)C family spore germination C-terminal domain-containing protein [Clostridiales bacterium]
MRKLYRTLTAALLAAALAVSLTGCGSDFLPKGKEIAQIELMRTLAVDEAEGGLTRVTAAGGVRSDPEGGDSQPPVVLTAQGLTVAATCLTIRTAGDSTVSYSHVQECLIGEDMARQSLEPIVDYLERDYATRMDTKLFIVQGATAGELVEGYTTGQDAATDRLEAIARELPLKSEGWPYTLRHLLSDLKDNGSALMPMVTLDDSGETPDIQAAGLCWLEDGRMAGTLDRRLSQAASLITGNGESAVFELELEEGAAALNLTDADCATPPQWEGERLTGLTLTLTAECALTELQGYNLQQEGTALLDELEAALSDYLRQGVEEVVTLSQSEGVDFLHLRRLAAMACPGKKEVLNECWSSDFAALALETEAEVTLERSYDTIA